VRCLELAAAIALSLFGCISSSGAAPRGSPDRPVPPGEPRAEIALEVDLEPAPDCEERFDLALYRDRGIELVQWDARAGACSDRRVRLRYLSGRLTSDKVLAAVRKAARDVKPAEPPAPPAR
jgi:hypothetical protein